MYVNGGKLVLIGNLTRLSAISSIRSMKLKKLPNRRCLLDIQCMSTNVLYANLKRVKRIH